MSDFKNLIDKIISDAEMKRQDIISKANIESDRIVSKKIQEANQYREQIINKAHVEGEELKVKAISKCELKIRNNRLQAKRKVLDEIFKSSLDELINLSEEKFRDYLVNVLGDLSLFGDYKLIIPNIYLNVIGESQDYINSKLEKDFKIIEIKPSDKLKGGFILEKNNVFINYSFEVLVNFIREKIEFEVSNLLFN